MLGLGPRHYCIIDSKLPEMDKRILLLLYHLPSSKFCFYSKKVSMGNTLLGSPWKEIVKESCECNVLHDPDLARNVYYSQQYEIWMDFGGTNPLQSLWEFEDYETSDFVIQD